MWIRQLLIEIGCCPVHKPILWCDNQSDGALATNTVFHARTKHIEIDVHFVRDQVLKGMLEVRYVPSFEQITDCFTKSVSHSQFHYLRSKLGLLELPSRLRENIRATTQCHVGATSHSSDTVSSQVRELSKTEWTTRKFAE